MKPTTNREFVKACTDGNDSAFAEAIVWLSDRHGFPEEVARKIATFAREHHALSFSVYNKGVLGKHAKLRFNGRTWYGEPIDDSATFHVSKTGELYGGSYTIYE